MQIVPIMRKPAIGCSNLYNAKFLLLHHPEMFSINAILSTQNIQEPMSAPEKNIDISNSCIRSAYYPDCKPSTNPATENNDNREGISSTQFQAGGCY